MRIEAREAVRFISAAAISVKGRAALTPPRTRNCLHRVRNPPNRPSTTAYKMSATAAKNTRISINSGGPRAGTATRMNRKDPPHNAPSKNNAPRSRTFMILCFPLCSPLRYLPQPSRVVKIMQMNCWNTLHNFI